MYTHDDDVAPHFQVRETPIDEDVPCDELELDVRATPPFLADRATGWAFKAKI